jgi:hexosaminidase
MPSVGKSYSFQEIAQINDYAKSRGIVIIPEFEAPGHAASLNRAYPELFGNTIESTSATLITENGDVITDDSIICAGSDKAMSALRIMVNEICELFPEAPYIHIGGDEANINAWNYCTDCKKYMQEHDLANVKEMYCEFIGKITDAVISRGKTPIVWEGFPKEYSHLVSKDTVVLSWENYYNYTEDLLADGFRIINASWQPLYIIPAYDRGWYGKDIYDWDVYNWQHWWVNSRATVNPVHVAPTDQVIGAQICSWECTYDQEINKILENLATLSERTWNLTRVCSQESFAARLRAFNMRIARLIQDR